MGIKASASVTVAQVTDGTDGNGIKSTVVEYQAGASGTTAPTGSWSTSIPATTASAPYLWTKVTYTYTDGSAPKVVYSVGSTPEGIVVGGRNLLKKSDIKSFDTSFLNVNGYEITQMTGYGAGLMFDHSLFDVGQTYVLSLKFQKLEGTLTSIAGHCAGFKTNKILINDNIPNDNPTWWDLTHTIEDSSDIQNIKVCLTYNGNAGDNNLYVQPQRNVYHNSNDIKIKYWDIKLEIGNKATDWTPAPEDVDASIAAVNKKVNNAQLEIDTANGKIATLTSETSSLGTRMTTVEQTASDLTVRINTTDSNVATAQSTADTAKANAATAQSTANAAKSTADTAKSTADTAKANAATAQSTANTARNEAANAEKTATNYLNFSSKGLIVGDVTASTLGNNVLIDSDSVDIRSGDTVLASFGSKDIYIGKESPDANVDFCDGLGSIGYMAGDVTERKLYIFSESEIELHTGYSETIDASYFVTDEDGTILSDRIANIVVDSGNRPSGYAFHAVYSNVLERDYKNDKVKEASLSIQTEEIMLTVDSGSSSGGTKLSAKIAIHDSDIKLCSTNVVLNATPYASNPGTTPTTTINGVTTINASAQVVGTLTVGSPTSNSGIEIYHDTPFVDFHANRSGTVDFTSRIIADTDGGLTIYTQNGGCAYKLLNGFFRTYGNTGWYSETYGGGWYMIDNVWVRTYGEKSLYTGAGSIYTHGGEFYAALDHGLHCVSTGHWIIRTFNSSAGMVSVGVGNGSEPLRLFTNGKVWKGNSTTTYFSTASSSDKRLKKDFGEITDAYEKMYMDTDVYSFRYILEDDIIHYGFMAQDVIENMERYGIPLDNNLYGKSKSECFERDITGDDYTYNINYLEWIPLNKHMITKTINRLDKFEESSQQQIDQLREELSQTRTDYVELLTEVKRLKEKLESVA